MGATPTADTDGIPTGHDTSNPVGLLAATRTAPAIRRRVETPPSHRQTRSEQRNPDHVAMSDAANNNPKPPDSHNRSPTSGRHITWTHNRAPLTTAGTPTSRPRRDHASVELDRSRPSAGSPTPPEPTEAAGGFTSNPANDLADAAEHPPFGRTRRSGGIHVIDGVSIPRVTSPHPCNASNCAGTADSESLLRGSEDVVRET